MNQINLLSDYIYQSITKYLSFLNNEFHFSLKIENAYKGGKLFIFEKGNLRISIGHEPFDIWCNIEFIKPKQKYRKIGILSNAAGLRLAATKYSVPIIFNQKDLEAHMQEINVYLNDLAKEIRSLLSENNSLKNAAENVLIL